MAETDFSKQQLSKFLIDSAQAYLEAYNPLFEKELSHKISSLPELRVGEINDFMGIVLEKEILDYAKNLDNMADEWKESVALILRLLILFLSRFPNLKIFLLRI